MRHFEAKDPDFAGRVRASFGRQKVMAFMGAEISSVVPGRCEIRLPYKRSCRSSTASSMAA